ncbi:uncharacterized protein LOC129727644 isoform X2 [Wyeomyia smithii]|uniref:uncharacterized protein LOC129727644 isoform X2 n=1 Tax=Wyeomyia smithii TaxID=174621 RepID=UPI0024680498|nr:uncharacterized protein LOC129727644 isoform X2 [Wyeomyia smithii]
MFNPVSFLKALDDEKDFFRPLEYSLVVAGVTLRTSNPIARGLFNIYRCLLIMHVCLWFERLRYWISDSERKTEMIGSIAFLCELTVVLIRVGITYRYLNTIRNVQQFLRQRFDDYRNPDRNRSYRKIRLVVVMLIVSYVSVLLMQLFFGVLEEPFFVAPPHLLQQRFLATWFKYRIHVTFDAIFTSIFTANLTIINSYLIAFDVEVKQTSTAYKKLTQKVDEIVKQNIINSSELTFKQRKMSKELRFITVLKQELFIVIKSHIDLMDQLHDLKKFLNLTFMCMFYTQIVVSGCLLFFITLDKLTLLAVAMLSYGFTGMLECFWYCQLTNNLSESRLEMRYTLRTGPIGFTITRQFRQTIERFATPY